MKNLRAAFGTAAALAWTLLACSGGPEHRIVDQYFNAVQHQDDQTLGRFAAVKFDKKVDSWKVKETVEDTHNSAPLPDLVKKMKDAEKAVADNKKAAQTYVNEHYAEYDKVKALQNKGAAVPAKLKAVADELDKYNQKDRELRKALSDAKEAVERERRHAQLSLGDRDDVDKLSGEVLTKKVRVAVTSGGQTQDYIMTLRKYDVKGDSGPQPVSRWMVQSVSPAG
jgi:hypothetical protein